MDCKEFNEYITEYEARRLTKKQEDEFLQHKNSCPDCKQIFELVFGSDFESIDDCNFSFDDNVCISVMDKIQKIEKNGYNIRLQNFLHIFFGLLTVSTVIFIILGLENSLRSIQTSNWNSINHFSDSLCDAIGLASHSLTTMYLHSLIYIIYISIAVSFVIFLLETLKKGNNLKSSKEKN